MYRHRTVGELISISTLLFLLQACGDDGGSGGDSAGEAAVSTIVSSDLTIDISLSGSVGDGPIANANLIVTSVSGKILSNAISDELAGYNLQLKTQGKHFPLTIEAEGGIDLVTQLPPGFRMVSVAAVPRNQAVANINPFSTLIVAIARQQSARLTAVNISSALGTVVSQFNLGMTSRLALDPISTPVDDSNLAEMVKSSEALAEIFRRTTATARIADPGMSIETVIEAIAADLADGALDGRGGSRTNRRVSAAALLTSSQVAMELIVNELRVDGVVVTDILDGVIVNLADDPNTIELTGSRLVNSLLIEQARRGVAAAIALGGSSNLQTLLNDLSQLRSGMTATTAAALLPADAESRLDSATIQIGSGASADLATVLSAGSTVTQPEPTPGSTPDPTPEPTPTTGGGNTPPQISGTPASQVMQGTAYQFQPSASDADGDLLLYTIVNRPSWATFNIVTGVLSGMPTAADVGTYSNIRISVSDGRDSTQLQAFSVTVQAVALGTATLSWAAPTENTDGGPLLDLAGYRIHWGQSSGNYSQTVDVMNPGITTYVVDNLTGGTYYFVATAIRAGGLESAFSNEASKTIF
ncbi:MAG TPA: putative Ig domain-containing protein [Gammaproteobacteria bacterium]|jgi:hypothetical protein